MATAREATIEVQEKVLDSLRVGQKAAVDSVRAWSSTVETFFTRLPDFAVVDVTQKPADFVENAFAFGERLLASQRDFANRLFEAAVPAAKGANGAVRATAAKA